MLIASTDASAQYSSGGYGGSGTQYISWGPSQGTWLNNGDSLTTSGVCVVRQTITSTTGQPVDVQATHVKLLVGNSWNDPVLGYRQTIDTIYVLIDPEGNYSLPAGAFAVHGQGSWNLTFTPVQLNSIGGVQYEWGSMTKNTRGYVRAPAP